jgi:hypothetical protein
MSAGGHAPGDDEHSGVKDRHQLCDATPQPAAELIEALQCHHVADASGLSDHGPVMFSGRPVASRNLQRHAEVFVAPGQVRRKHHR